MVDSEDTASLAGDIVSAAEDSDFFKRVVGYISFTNDDETKEVKEIEESDESKKEKKKALKRKKKQENKNEKRVKTSESQSVDESPVNGNADDSINNDIDFTQLKQKKPEVDLNEIAQEDPVLAASLISIEDKRAKLRTKIAELQAKRNPTNRELLDKKKLKRQESKMKLKQKKKLEKTQNKQKAGMVTPKKGNTSKGVTPNKPVYNKEGQLVFSKFDFTDSGKKVKKNTDLHGKDYKRLLEKIERRNEKINQVKSKDETKGKALEEKFKWDAVLHKAEGEKVKDNPELLKKALKRKDKIKTQKKKKWENRVQQVEKTKDERVQKRNENIQKRKQTVKDKKMKKLKKKGRLIPGF